jgi:hypothetical protein
VFITAEGYCRMTTYPKFFGSSVFPYGVERRRPGVDPQRLLQQLRRIFICPRRTPRIGKVLIHHGRQDRPDS